MISIGILFYLFILGDCVSVFRNNSEPLSVKLSYPLPDLAPYEENERIDALGGLDRARRIYIQKLFSDAFYNDECGKTSGIVVAIGKINCQRVSLPCRFCDRKEVYSGHIKYWSVLRTGNFLNKIDRLYGIPRSDWKVIDENSTKEFRADFEKYIYMPLFDPNGRRSYKKSAIGWNIRPIMRFIQRDGRLKIIATEADAYGLYRCFDNNGRSNQIQFVYFLIPILPIYMMKNSEIHRFECAMGRYSDPNNFVHLDSNHRFRFIPPTLWNSTEQVKNFCSPNWEGCQNTTFEPKPLDLKTSTVLELQLNLSTKRIEKIYDMNLKVFIHWSPWSACDGIRKLRTRQGYCHVGKIDSSKVFRPTGDETRIIEGRNVAWLMSLHKLIEKVDEFRQNGIPLFSGILSNLLSNDLLPVTQCIDFDHIEIAKAIRDNYNTLWSMILQPIIDLGAWQSYKDFKRDQISRLTFTPCFYYNNTDKGQRHILYSYPINQNENCD